MEKTYTRVLTIAGSDSSGGAGIQADLKTMSALGCYGLSAVTAVTAQNTTGVTFVSPMTIESVEKQIDAVMSDIGADAVKIGMIWSADMAESVSVMLEKYACTNVVFDPVMVAQSGDALFKENDALNLVRNLTPRAHLITPNLTEASFLLGREIKRVEDMEDAAKSLTALGCDRVLVKGGHLLGETLVDVLYDRKTGDTALFREQRVRTANNHGTGCTLSSAIASYLAKGLDIKEAVSKAKTFITLALAKGAAYKTGHGHGPVHHFHAFWE